MSLEIKHKQVALHMRPDLWKAFRVACLQRNTSASEEIRRLVDARMHEWIEGDQVPGQHAYVVSVPERPHTC